MHLFYDVFKFILTFSILLVVGESCPEVCRCNAMKLVSPNKAVVGQKVTCSSVKDLLSFSTLHMQFMPNDTLHLVLRENELVLVPSFSFTKCNNLKKLDLSKNNISEIQENAFENLTLLEKLDLSHNKIARITPNVFNSLSSLLRLNLQMNYISRLPHDVTKSLTTLKALDLSNNYLICDCHLKWLIDWSRSKKVHISPKTTCNLPRILEGVPLVRISRKEFHCQWPLELPIFELVPHVSQLVFEGDSFAFTCRVSHVEDSIELMWMVNDKKLNVHEDSAVNITMLLSNDIIFSTATINDINHLHSGTWKCFVNSSKGFELRSVELVVISSHGNICHRVISDGNRGHYEWPETPAGITIELECTGVRASSLSYQNARAYHTCSRSGIWENLNTSSCPYTSEVTNVLEQFSKANFSSTYTNILSSARLLQNYTSDQHIIKEKMDVVFISRTLQNYMHAVPYNHEIAEVIVDVINTLMSVNKSILIASELEDEACTRILAVMEQIPELLTDVPLNHANENIAVEDFFVKSDSFPGIVCSSYLKNNYIFDSYNSLSKKNVKNEKFLNCNIASPSLTITELDSVEASLQLPPTIFQQMALGTVPSVHKLQFITYRNSMLFSRSIQDQPIMDVTSLVISGKIVHKTSYNLSDPIIISLRTAAYTSDIKPVWWDSSAIGGKGDWSDEGCSIIKVQKNVVTFSCNRLASFGLLQNVEALLIQYAFEKAQFRFLHPVVYCGTFICIISLIATVIIYCLAYKKLKMPSKLKHSIINTFLSVILLCFVFTFGVNQTDIVSVCQGVGFLLHYLSLCSLFWMLVTASNFYKKLVKRDLTLSSSSESLPEQPLPPKPMLRFYLVGWGISSIICGISAAVDIHNYGGLNFCFLSLSPCLGALYGPSLFLLFLLSCLYLLSFCAVRRKGSEECVKDISVHEDIADAANAVYGEKHSESEQEDSIQSYEIQLRGHATLLLLYLLTWLSASAYVGRPLQNHLPYDQVLFASLFCVFSSILGIYTFVFFCYFREDASQYISIMFKKFSRKNTNEVEIIPMVNNPSIFAQTISSPQKVENAAFKNSTASACDSASLQQNSVHAYSSEHSVNNAKVFYDPRQSELARRFFEKNRRQQQMQLMQKNSLKRIGKSKSEASANVKYSKASNSSQIILDYKSESLNEDRSSGSQNSSVFTHKSKYKGEHKNTKIHTHKLRYFGENMCHVFSSDNSQLPTSAFCQSCCSDMSSDILSKPNTREKYEIQDKSHQYKCCNSQPPICYNVNKCKQGTSFSAEDLKCHCTLQSYCECHKSSNNMVNLRSNSEMSVVSCKYMKTE